MYEALRKGATVDEIFELTKVKTYFIEQMKELVEEEEKLLACKGNMPSDEMLTSAKKDGFSDKYLSQLLEIPEEDIRNKRISIGVEEAWEGVHVSGTPDSAYYYSTYNAEDKNPVSTDKQKIMILGGGPNRIGQGIEFDYCSVHAAIALKEHGFDKKIILDHNLYIFNQSSRAFWVQHGVSEMTAPLELNARELGNLGLTNMELPVYGYLPVMISAQCIQNTVRGCTHTAGLMTLSDRKGLSLQVKNFCDLCYNVIYDPSPLCLLEFYAEIQELAPLRSRLQFTSETGEQVCRILRLFCTENNYTERTSVEIPFDYMTGHYHRGII